MAAEDDAAATPLHTDRYQPGRGFTHRDAHVRRLDAMRDGVADDLHERILHRVEDVPVEADVAAFSFEIHGLRQRMCGIASSSLERCEEHANRDEAQLLGDVADLVQLPIHPVAGGAEAALQPADRGPEFLGHRLDPVGAGERSRRLRIGGLRRELTREQLRNMAGALDCAEPVA